MRKVRIAQIGMNQYSHGNDVFETLTMLPDVFEIVGYALVEDERETCKDKLHYFDGYKEMSLDEILNDPTIEAVTVETDEIHLTKYAQMAAEHGKHIHMEKPGGTSFPAFERLLDTMKETGKVFHIGYMFRYNPYIKGAIDSARAGEFGEIQSVEAHMSRFDGAVTRDWLNCLPGGMMFYLGCHLIDVILQIRGLPDRIIPLNRSSGIDGITAEDQGFAVLDYPNGVSFVKMTGTEIAGSRRRQIVVTGTKKSIEIKPLEYRIPGTKYMLTTDRTVSEFDENRKTKRTTETCEPTDRYAGMMCAFAAMVRGEIENPYTLDYERTLMRAILECCNAPLS